MPWIDETAPNVPRERGVVSLVTPTGQGVKDANYSYSLLGDKLIAPAGDIIPSRLYGQPYDVFQEKLKAKQQLEGHVTFGRFLWQPTIRQRRLKRGALSPRCAAQTLPAVAAFR